MLGCEKQRLTEHHVGSGNASVSTDHLHNDIRYDFRSRHILLPGFRQGDYRIEMRA